MKHLKEAAAAVAAMTDEQREALALRIPVVTIEGHAISLRNTCLLALQRERAATIIGGFRQWLAAGRCVRKGEQALWILCPMSRKAKEDEKGDHDGMVTLFREVAVFDVTQTDSLPAAADAPQPAKAEPAPAATV